MGTYNPEIYNIPFISIARLFKTPLKKHPLLLATAGEDQSVKRVWKDVSESLKLSKKIDCTAVDLYNNFVK